MAWRCVQAACTLLLLTVVSVTSDKPQDAPLKRSPQYLPGPLPQHPQALGQYVNEAQAHHPVDEHLPHQAPLNSANHGNNLGSPPPLHANLDTDTGNPAGEAYVHVQHTISTTTSPVPFPYAPSTIHPPAPYLPPALTPAVKVNYSGAPKRPQIHQNHVAQSYVSNHHHQYEVITDYLPDLTHEPIHEHGQGNNHDDSSSDDVWKPLHVNPEQEQVQIPTPVQFGDEQPTYESPVTEPALNYDTATVARTPEYGEREQESVGPHQHEIYPGNENQAVHEYPEHLNPHPGSDSDYVVLSAPLPLEGEVEVQYHQQQHIGNDDQKLSVQTSYHEQDQEHAVVQHTDHDNGHQSQNQFQQEYRHEISHDLEHLVPEEEPHVSFDAQPDHFSSQPAPALYAPALPPRPLGLNYGQPPPPAPYHHHTPASPSYNPYIPQPPPYVPPQPEAHQPYQPPQTESYQQTLPLIPIYSSPPPPYPPQQQQGYQPTPRPLEYPTQHTERPYVPVTSPVPPSYHASSEEHNANSQPAQVGYKEVQVPAYTPSPNVPSASPNYEDEQSKPPVSTIRTGAYATGGPVTAPPIEDEYLSDAAPVPEKDTDVSGKNAGTAIVAPEESQWTKGSIPFVLEQMGFNTIIDLIILAGLDGQIEKEGPFTIFAPTDAAFDLIVERQGGLDKATENYNKNPEILDSLMKHHVAPGIVPLSAMYSPNFLTQSLTGAPLRGKTFIAEDQDWKPVQVLTINGARILRGDIKANNGIIHIIDRVMAPVPQADIYSTLRGDPEGRFTTLTSIIEKSGLLPVLANPRDGPYTIFAPTNKAFSLISKADLNAILYDPLRLKKLLLRHVVKDVIYTAGLQSFQKAYALDYELLYIYHMKGMTKVNGANLIDIDITTLNGVIHPIDSVLGF